MTWADNPGLRRPKAKKQEYAPGKLGEVTLPHGSGRRYSIIRCPSVPPELITRTEVLRTRSLEFFDPRAFSRRGAP